MRRFINALSGIYTPSAPMYDNDDGSGGGGGGRGDDDGADKRTVTMTQAELDALIGREKGRATKKFADYDELKAERDRLKAEEDARKAAELTETQRLQAEKDEALRKAAEETDKAAKAKEAADRRVVDAEIRSIARSFNANDASDVLSFVDKAKITVDEDGNVVGVEDAVKAVKEAKPYLFKPATTGADAGGSGNPNRSHDPNAADRTRLAELAEVARRTNRIEDKVAYAELKRKIETK